MQKSLEELNTLAYNDVLNDNQPSSDDSYYLRRYWAWYEIAHPNDLSDAE